MVNKLLVLLLTMFFFFCSASYILASGNYFYDDFSTFDDDSWNIDPDESSYLRIIDNSYISFQPINSYKYAFLSKGLNFDNNLIIETRFRFSGSPNYGAGIILSDKLIPNNKSDGISWNDIVYMIWPTPSSGFQISTVVCPETDNDCIKDSFNGKIFSGESDKWYTVKIYLNGDRYNVEVDGQKIFSSSQSERLVKYIYLGSPERTGGVVWPIFDIDSIKISSEIQKNPVVIIPGLGASWDYAALLNNSTSDNWQVPAYVNTYDSLIKSFENAGYTMDKDLFVFAYDWRKPLDKLTQELSAFLIGHFNSGQKVDIVGHSLGGLLARVYEQNYGSDRIDKLITLGSPHRGAIDAYSVWENASVWGNIWWEKAALEMVLQLNKKLGVNRVDNLRTQAPIFKDILPTYDFLSLNGNLKQFSQLNQVNSYLSGMNMLIQPLNITACFGNSEQTKSILNATVRSPIDTLLGNWEDGKPVNNNPFQYTVGDGTVITSSATSNFTNLGFNSNHVGLPSNKQVIENIFDKFGLDKSKVEVLASDDRKNLFTAMLRSPGKLEICDTVIDKCNEQLGIYIPEYKLFMFPGYNNENLRIRISEDGTGNYKLNLGTITDVSNWQVIEGRLDQSGQIDTYYFGSKSLSKQINPDAKTSDRLMSVCKSSMNSFSPGWDRTNVVESITNNNLASTLRIKYTRLLKLILRNEIWKAKLASKSDLINQALICWEDVDYEINNLITSPSLGNASRYQDQVSKLGRTVYSKLMSTKNKDSLTVYQKALDKLDESRSVTNNGQLATELSSSAEQLFLVSLDLK